MEDGGRIKKDRKERKNQKGRDEQKQGEIRTRKSMKWIVIERVQNKIDTSPN